MSIRKDVAHEIAAAIWEDEQKASALLYSPEGANPLDPKVIHMNGRAQGLQRARDIAEEVGGRDV